MNSSNSNTIEYETTGANFFFVSVGKKCGKIFQKRRVKNGEKTETKQNYFDIFKP